MTDFSTWGTITLTVGMIGTTTVICGFFFFMNKLNKL